MVTPRSGCRHRARSGQSRDPLLPGPHPDGPGWTGWGPVLRAEAGLLRADDWTALAVTLPDDPGRDRQSPAPILRREFELPGPVARARLYVTSLGLHEVTINGRSVTDSALGPGWTPYARRLTGETYDVTELLTAGPNAIRASLGDGWYRGRLGWDPGEDRCKYGRELALIAQLEVELADGSTVRVVTDAPLVRCHGRDPVRRPVRRLHHRPAPAG